MDNLISKPGEIAEHECCVLCASKCALAFTMPGEAI